MNSQQSWELDHLFICTTPGAPEAQLLLQFRLSIDEADRTDASLPEEVERRGRRASRIMVSTTSR